MLSSVVLIVFGLYIIRKYREHQWGYCKSKSLLTEKVFLITGCNSGIGKEVARALAERNACVIMACRDLHSARSAIRDIRESTSSGSLVPMHLDLASFESVRKFAQEVLEQFPQIHVLINNAGVYFPTTSNETTVDGYEINFGVNHLGHYLLTNLLINRIKDSSPSRIIIVSSGLCERGIIDVTDLNMERRKMNLQYVKPPDAYCASKLANIYHSRELAERLRNTGVDVFALSPGFTFTNLFRHSKIRWWYYIAFLPVAFLYMRSSWQGAQTVIHCATDENLDGKSGQIFHDCRPYVPKIEFDPEIQKQLWQKSQEFTKSPQ